MSEPSPANKCPACGAALPANAPEGLCPKCLLLGVAAPTDPGSGQTPPRPPPPSREAVAAAFPHLEIRELIGQGGMGCVIKARQPQLNRFVALKILPESLARDAAFAARFTREAQALAALSHPNIVTIYDFGHTGRGDVHVAPSGQGGDKDVAAPGFFYLLMEYVDGVNLRQALKAGRFTPEQALAIVPPLCDALQFAHERGIVHRDIKPENLLLDKDGRIKVADFGIAKMLAADGAAASQPPDPTSPSTSAAGKPPLPSSLTGDSAAGTPGYMAPEQKSAPQKVDRRADIYSLGVVFYEMLTGELPGEKLQPPSRKVQIGVRLDEVVLRALEQKPEMRYQTAAEMRTQVVTIAASPPPSSASSLSPPAAWLRPIIVVGRRGGHAVIHWPGVLLGFVLALVVLEGAAIAASLLWEGRINRNATVIAFLTALMITGIRIRHGRKVPVGQLLSLDEPRAATDCLWLRPPWQIWVAVAMLALEGIGNLLAIPRQPEALYWLAAKGLFIAGLLLRWRPVFVLFLAVTAVHVIYFLPAAPAVAALNVVLLALVGSAFRFYFSGGNGETSSAAPPLPGTDAAAKADVSMPWKRLALTVGFHAGLWIVLVGGLSFCIPRLLEPMRDLQMVLSAHTAASVGFVRFLQGYWFLLLPLLIGLDFAICAMLEHLGKRRWRQGWSAVVISLSCLMALGLLVSVGGPVWLSRGKFAEIRESLRKAELKNAPRVARTEETLRREITRKLAEAGWQVEGLFVSMSPDLKRAECRFGKVLKSGFQYVPFNASLRLKAQGAGLWLVEGDGEFRDVRFSVDASAELLGGSQPGSPSVRPAPRFGPDTERIVNDLDDRQGNEALDLRTGRLSSIPAAAQTNRAALDSWMKTNQMDLLVDFARNRWALLSVGLKVAECPNVQWDAATQSDLASALAAPPTLERNERSGQVFYLLPTNVHPPLTLAFETQQGHLGLLQIRSFTVKPSGVVFRYKLALAVAAPQTGSSAPFQSSEKHSITFTNGVSVEVVAVCRNPRQAPVWWKPDGTRLGPLFELLELARIEPPRAAFNGEPENEFLIYQRWSLPPDAGRWQPRTKWSPAPDPDQENLWVMRNPESRRSFEAESIYFTNPPVAVDCRMEIATEADPWETVAVFDGHHTRERVHGVMVACGTPTPRENPQGYSFEVMHNVDRELYALRARARLRDGREFTIMLHAGTLTHGIPAKGFAHYIKDEFKLSEVKEHVIERTPWVRGELHRISLKPNDQAQSGTEVRTAAADPKVNAAPTGRANAKDRPRLQFRLVTDASDTAPADTLADPAGKKPLRVRREVLLDETAIASATMTKAPADGHFQVEVTFTEAGSKRFAEITGANIRKRLAIIFDGQVLSAPVIMSELHGKAVITGNLAAAMAEAIVKALSPVQDTGQQESKKETPPPAGPPPHRPFEIRLVVDGPAADAEEAVWHIPNSAAGAVQAPEKLFLQRGPLLDERMLAAARVRTNTPAGVAEIGVALTPQGATRFAEITRQHQGRRLAIMVDGKVYMAPRVREPISGGVCVITGNIPPDEARDLARWLDACRPRSDEVVPQP